MNSINDKYIKAGNPHTSLEELRQLATDDIDNVRRRVAENLKTPADLLSSLAQDENAEVRMAVAENPNTPPAVIRQLSQDLAVDVRYSMAENANMSQEILLILLDDEHPYVSHRARQTLRACANPDIREFKPPIDWFRRDFNRQ